MSETEKQPAVEFDAAFRARNTGRREELKALRSAAMAEYLRQLDTILTILLGWLLGLLTPVFRFSWRWSRRSPGKVKERTHEEATEALHTGREGRHPQAASA
jgi:hypothetical protein